MFRVNSKDAGDLAGEFDITPQPAWEEELEPERIKVLRPQRHEKIVEQVEVEVEQEIEEITQKPVDYLVSARGKHGNERVREATQAILVPLVEAAEGRGNNTQYEPVLVNSPFVPRIPTNRFDQPASPLEEVRNGKRLIDVLLVDVMEHRIELQTEAFVEKVEEIILKLSGFIGINVRPQPKYVDSFMRRFGSVFSPLLRALVFSQHHTYRLEQELSNMLIAHLTESYIASIEVAYKRATSRQNYSEKELQTEVESGRNYARSVLPEWVQAAINSLITFEGHLLTLCEALEEKPIKIGTGQKRMVKRIQPHITYLTHESEKLTIPRKTIMHPQRTYADMLNEVASQLTNLPVFTARVKITSDYGIKEHTIRTLDPKQDTDRPLFKQALEDRIASIKTQNIQNGYLRERSEVEAEIRIRQEQCSEPPEAEPPISRHPSR